MDGKTLRGTATPTDPAVHLLAALAPNRHLLAQARVPAGTSEIDALAVLLAGVDLAGVVVTADALHAQTGTAAHLVEELHAHYVLTVKRRGHWNIEAWHHVKDVSLGEDACKVRSGHAADNLAALRAIALVFLSRLGQDTLPDAIRWVSYEAFTRPLDVIGLRRPARTSPLTENETALGVGRLARGGRRPVDNPGMATRAIQSGERRALSRQNSLPSGSARTCHCSSPVWPMSAGRAPSSRRRSSSAS